MTTAPTTLDNDGAWPTTGATLASKYEIAEVIGRGGTSVIYRAKELGLGREVALKVLDLRRGDASAMEQRKKRFYRSARLMAQLTAPSTVRMYDYGRMPSGLLFLVFEFVKGETLEERLRSGPLPEASARAIVLQVLESLREAHALGFLHRDVKPANIMLYPRLGQADGVKVLDYGIAKEVSTERVKEVTTAGQVVGTPRYLAPERIVGKPHGSPSDLFSVGLVAYEMLVGQSPVAHLGGVDVAKALTTQEFSLPPGLDVTDELRAVVDRMLAREPRGRFQSVDDAFAALGVDVEPVERQTHGGDAVVAFPIGLDPLGGTPVDELTGTTNVHSLTVTTSSIQQLPAPEPEVDEVGATQFEPAGVDEARAGRWRVVAAVVAILFLLGLFFVFFGKDAPDPFAPGMNAVDPGSETVAPEMNFDEPKLPATATTYERAAVDVERALRFGKMAAELAAQKQVETSEGQPEGGAAVEEPGREPKRRPSGSKPTRKPDRKPGRKPEPSGDEPLEIEAMDELE